MDFKVGDKVKLRSGGRVMIVSLVVGDPPPWPWPRVGVASARPGRVSPGEAEGRDDDARG